MKYLILLLALLCFKVQADPWDTTDKALAAVAVTALVVDWSQTRYVAKHPEQFTEKNPLLGEHPSVGKVNTHFAVAIAGTLLFADWLSPTGRRGFLIFLTIIEISVINKNHSIGVKMDF